jgi:hypothetical protein
VHSHPAPIKPPVSVIGSPPSVRPMIDLFNPPAPIRKRHAHSAPTKPPISVVASPSSLPPIIDLFNPPYAVKSIKRKGEGASFISGREKLNIRDEKMVRLFVSTCNNSLTYSFTPTGEH